MSALDAIEIRAEYETGNVRPLLHEIRHALARLAEGEDGTIIDMSSLPLAPGEEVERVVKVHVPSHPAAGVAERKPRGRIDPDLGARPENRVDRRAVQTPHHTVQR